MVYIRILTKTIPGESYISQNTEKGKCGGARNLGMDICTGKYIAFVDADDYVHPDMLRVLHDRMTEDDYDVAQCGVSCFKEAKPNVLEASDYEIQRLDLDNVDNRKNLIIGLTGFTNVTAWAKLYSTKFIREHNLRFVEDVYYEHTHFSMLCVLLAKKYCKVQSTLYYYFENTGALYVLKLAMQRSGMLRLLWII